MIPEPDNVLQAEPEYHNLPDALQQFDQQIWRLNNLYYIINESGHKVPFQLREIQEQFLKDMWYRNIILKSRQHGFSTLIGVFALDCTLFLPDINSAIIAQTQSDTQRIFESKVEFPYKSLPQGLRDQFPVERSNLQEMKFAHNGSSIEVTQSFRSATSQVLHISEYGKISKENPQKAKEIRTGALPTSHKGSYVFIESTAEGTEGEFYDMCQQAMADKQEGIHLTPLDFKFHFYAWHQAPHNRLSEADAERVVIPSRLVQYFRALKDEQDIRTDHCQQAWYVVTEKSLGGEMKREHPSHPNEAFDQSSEGTYFSQQLTIMREQGRICEVPYTAGHLVHTFWDLGLNDEMSIWFGQKIGESWNLIHYYENTDYGLDWYIDQLFLIRDERKWQFGLHWAPHDIERRELSSAVTTWKQARDMGVTFEVVARPERKNVSIQAARSHLSICKIDKQNCDRGIKCLENYRKQWDELRGAWKDIPLHNRACLCGSVRIITREGSVRMEDLPETGEVLTKCGWKRYKDPCVTRRNAPLVAVEFDDGYTVSCTAEHKFLTTNGWCLARNLTSSSLIQSSSIHSFNTLKASCIERIRQTRIIRAASYCIGSFGRRSLVRYPKLATFITRMKTWSTTVSPTLNASLSASIHAEPGRSVQDSALAIGLRETPEIGQRIGMTVQRVDYGILGKLSGQRAGRNGSAVHCLASCAALLSKMHLFGGTAMERSSVPRVVGIKSVCGFTQKKNTWKRTGTAPRKGGDGILSKPNDQRPGRNGSAAQCLVRCAELLSKMRLFVPTLVQNIVPRSAEGKRVRSVRQLEETADVWCLTVPEVHHFALENGAIVHNSNGADAFQTMALAVEKMKNGQLRGKPRQDPRRAPSNPDDMISTVRARVRPSGQGNSRIF